jgi:hypothetical protein
MAKERAADVACKWFFLDQVFEHLDAEARSLDLMVRSPGVFLCGFNKHYRTFTSSRYSNGLIENRRSSSKKHQPWQLVKRVEN